LAEILSRIENFRPDEVDVALELIDEALTLGDATTYRVLVAEEGDTLLGYVCFGATPMTDHTYDLYWIVVDTTLQGRGVGRQLWTACREAVVASGGRLIRVETSSTELYEATKAFYAAIRLDLAATIVDFYRPGDDLLIYMWRG
jgi:ribosomal protein S18 acetylase RimI-like enzyme